MRTRIATTTMHCKKEEFQKVTTTKYTKEKSKVYLMFISFKPLLHSLKSTYFYAHTNIAYTLNHTYYAQYKNRQTSVFSVMLTLHKLEKISTKALGCHST